MAGTSSSDPIVLSSDDNDDDEEECEVVKVVEGSTSSKTKKWRKDPSSSGSSTAAASVPTSIPYNHPPQTVFPASVSFRTALSELISSFETNETNKSHPIHRVVYYSTPSSVCIYDKYHKARKHLLLIPRPDNSPLGKISSINDIIPFIHLQHLRNFHALGREIAAAVSGSGTDDKSWKYPMLCGYHAVPSLTPLHLHIISSDFDSDCIKNKKHINSFTDASFFISPDVLERHMESAPSAGMRVQVNTQRATGIINSTPFRCFRCGASSGTVTQWKFHNSACNAKVPEGRCNASLLGWKSSSSVSSANGKKRKADDESSGNEGKDIRKFFGSNKGGGVEGPIY